MLQGSSFEFKYNLVILCSLPPPPPLQAIVLVQAIASVDREEMFAEHMKERERRKRAEEKAARKRKLQDFRELLERTSDIKV